MKLAYSLILAFLFSTSAFSADFNKVWCDLGNFGKLFVNLPTQTVWIDGKIVKTTSLEKKGNTINVKLPAQKPNAGSYFKIAAIEILVPKALLLWGGEIVYEGGTLVSVIKAYDKTEDFYYGCSFI